jgi:3,4-dihydroxy 2-butanone 4-phosphate synthase/GTP cyclohydrolase II
MRLITNHRQAPASKGYGLEVVERVPIITEPNPFNVHYSIPSAAAGHLLDGLEGGD